VNVHFQNTSVTFEFQGHGVNIKVTRAKKRPRAGMCFPGYSLIVFVSTMLVNKDEYIILVSEGSTNLRAAAFCCRDLDLKPMTLKLDPDLDIL